MQHGDALCLTSIEKANSFEIDKVHFFEIQHNSWFAACDLGSYLIEVFASQLPAQPNSRSALARNPFNLQRHISRSPKLTVAYATIWPFPIHWEKLDLDDSQLLNLEQLVIYGQSAADSSSCPTMTLSGCFSLESVFIDAEALDLRF